MSTRTRLLLSIAASLVMFAAASPPIAGQAGGEIGRPGGLANVDGQVKSTGPAGPIPRRADGHPDLTGTWNGSPGGVTHTVILEEHPPGFGVLGGQSLILEPKDGIIPYLPWALEERDRRRDDANGYEDQVGHCEFYDVGRIHSFTQEYLFSGNTFVINATQHITRIVPMDGRAHLPPGIRLWLGDPVGHWEGDTLVVDSTNFNDRTRMSLGGDFHGADAHIVERFQMLDANTIKWTMTIDNPKVFSKPWTMTSPAPMKRIKAVPDFDVEDTCHEGNVDLVHLKNTYYQAHGKDARPKYGTDTNIRR
ncbi:MAG TPA: hypothetical protein VN654_28935 [Vicinamibacterales bacterium]|nr:hypothetical protein [Vicinamibacterales bacterium]